MHREKKRRPKRLAESLHTADPLIVRIMGNLETGRSGMWRFEEGGEGHLPPGMGSENLTWFRASRRFCFCPLPLVLSCHRLCFFLWPRLFSRRLCPFSLPRSSSPFLYSLSLR